MEDILYELLTLNKTKVIKLQPNPSAGEGPLLCDTQCNMEIKYSTKLISPDKISCHINPQKKYMRLDISDTDNYILYQGANSAVGASYIKTADNIISDKYQLKNIFIFFNIGNYIDNKTGIDDIEVRLVHESINKNKTDSKIYITNVIHINGKGDNTSVQSKLYESIFKNILEYKTRTPNNNAYTQNLNTMCKKGNDCIASINCSNFIIDNTTDSGFYSYLDINVGHKLYWIIFQKEVSIRNSIFTEIKKYMNASVGIPQYITPKNGQIVYINIEGRKYTMKHFLYITPNGTEIPSYGQGKYGVRADNTDGPDDTKQVQDHTGGNGTDNLILLSTPNKKEKVVIEVDRKEHFNSTTPTRISDRIFDISNKLFSRLSNIKENYSTINIQQNELNDNSIELKIKSIIIYILLTLIVFYFLILKTNLYIKLIGFLIFIKNKIMGIFVKKQSIIGGDTDIDSTDIDSTDNNITRDIDSTEPHTIIKKQGGHKKVFKLGLKKMKRKLI